MVVQLGVPWKQAMLVRIPPGYTVARGSFAMFFSNPVKVLRTSYFTLLVFVT
jgi:hypothetical protein